MPPKKTTESPIERILLRAMQDYGMVPICQYEIGQYRVDFAFPEDNLVVEADGAAYHSSPKQVRRDMIRERRIRNRGWRVIRFTGAQILQDAYWCARKVYEEIHAKHRHAPRRGTSQTRSNPKGDKQMDRD